MTSPLFRDEMDCLIRGKAKDRAELDNPEYRQSTIFEKFAKAFNDPEVDISHPKDHHKLEGCIHMDPNETKRIEIIRDGKWFKRMYDTTMKHYRVAMIKWKAGTGSGKSSGQHFVNWQLREPYEFQKYDKVRGPLLGWIYMKDIAADNILDAKNVDIPKHIQVETTGTFDNNIPKLKSPCGSMMGDLDRRMQRFDFFYERYFVEKSQLNSVELLDVQLNNVERLISLKSKFYTTKYEDKFERKIQECMDAMLEPNTKKQRLQVLQIQKM